MAFANPSAQQKLVRNTLRFDFPTAPVTFYFATKKDGIAAPLYKLKHCTLFPAHVNNYFPDLKKNDILYTSFTTEAEGLTPIPVDFNDPNNWYLVKRFYNRLIENYFIAQKCPIYKTKIKDITVYARKKDSDLEGFCGFDKFTVKVDFDRLHRHPQLLVSFDGPALISRKNIPDFLSSGDGDPFAEGYQSIQNTDLSKVLWHKIKHDVEYLDIDRYEYISRDRDFDAGNAFPVMNKTLKAKCGIETEEDKGNRYLKFYEHIMGFYASYLDNDEFRSIVPIYPDGFMAIDDCDTAMTDASCKDLLFGKGTVEKNPQFGINDGPFKPVPTANAQVMYIFHKDDVQAAAKLYYMFRDGYGKKGYYPFDFQKYMGISVTPADKQCHIKFENLSDPLPEISRKLSDMYNNGLLADNITYVAVYLTPYQKHEPDVIHRNIYYSVKKMLLDYGIVSQCIETETYIKAMGDEEESWKFKFKYTLQNMAIAMCAKLGGIPWKLNVQEQNELIVGVGAYMHRDTKTRYIASAFAFDNTGVFNTFLSFQSDRRDELAGSIKEAVIRFRNANEQQPPQRIIIHFYKSMNMSEYYEIERALESLDCGGIPIYIVTIHKTESEDFVLFDTASSGMMPYSGLYHFLAPDTILLCNNTRYKGTSGTPDSFPFPIKLKISCPANESLVTPQAVSDIVNQVYQFSRIYWKSVKQQNLPVTIKYPEMVAEIMPYFQSIPTDDTFTRLPWFL